MKKILVLLLLTSVAFGQIKIPNLPVVTSASSNDFTINQQASGLAGTTKIITWNDLFNSGFVSGLFWKQGLNSFGTTGLFGTADANRIDFYSSNLIRGRLTAGGQWIFGATFPGATINSPLISVGSGTTSSTYAFGVYDAGLTNNYFALRNDSRMIYKDGNQGSGKFLTSDANGVATWASPSSLGYYVPLAGTATNTPLYGPIEFSVGTTALWQNSTTGNGFYAGTSATNNISTSTGDRHFLYLSPTLNDDVSRLYASDGAGSVSNLDINSNSQTLYSSTGANSSQIYLNPTQLQISTSYTSFVGATYNPTTAGYVTTNQNQYSLLHRAAGDARWLSTSYSVAPTSVTDPLSLTSNTLTLKYGTGLSVSSGSLVTSNIPNSALTNSTFTINGTGMALGTSSTITAAAGTLTGTTLNSTVVSSSLTSVGTLTTGTWNGSVISGTYGGTGVNNGSKTITLGGSIVTTGTATPTLDFPSTSYTYTLPSGTGTLIENNLGISGGSTIIGGTGAGESLNLLSTSNATKGNINFGTLSTYDVANNNLLIGGLTSDVWSIGAGNNFFNFQSPTTNNASRVQIVANGTGTAGFQMGNGSIRRCGISGIDGSHMTLFVNASNSGTALTQIAKFYSAGNISLGAESALSTSATDGFVYMPSGAGAPTGVPTSITGKVAFYYDVTNNKIYIYNGGWKAVSLL